MKDFNDFTKKSVALKVYEKFPQVSNLEIIKMDEQFLHPEDDDYAIFRYLYVFEMNVDNAPALFELESDYFMDNIEYLFTEIDNIISDLTFYDFNFNDKCNTNFIKTQIRLYYNHKTHKSSTFLSNKNLELISTIILHNCDTLKDAAIFIKAGFSDNGCMLGLLNEKPDITASFFIS